MMAAAIAPAIAAAIANAVASAWRTDAPNPNPNIRSSLALIFLGDTKSKSLRYVTRERATFGLGRHA